MELAHGYNGDMSELEKLTACGECGRYQAIATGFSDLGACKRPIGGEEGRTWFNPILGREEPLWLLDDLRCNLDGHCLHFTPKAPMINQEAESKWREIQLRNELQNARCEATLAMSRCILPAGHDSDHMVKPILWSSEPLDYEKTTEIAIRLVEEVMGPDAEQA